MYIYIWYLCVCFMIFLYYGVRMQALVYIHIKLYDGILSVSEKSLQYRIYQQYI